MKKISNADHRDVLKILEWVAGGCKEPSSIKSANLIRKCKILGRKFDKEMSKSQK